MCNAPESSVESPSRVEQRPGTFNLRGLLLLTAFVAGCLAVGRWLYAHFAEAAFFLVGVLAVVPLVLLLELVSHGRPMVVKRPAPARLGLNLVLLLGTALLFPAVFMLNLYGFLPLPPGTLDWSPLLYSLPIMLFYEPERSVWIFFSPAALSFLALNLYLVNATGPQPVPWRVPLLLAIATLSTIYWFVAGWSYGMKYQGASYVYETFALNAAALGALWTVWLLVRRKAGLATLLGLAVATHLWLFFFAFPWLGEVP